MGFALRLALGLLASVGTFWMLAKQSLHPLASTPILPSASAARGASTAEFVSVSQLANRSPSSRLFHSLSNEKAIIVASGLTTTELCAPPPSPQAPQPQDNVVPDDIAPHGTRVWTEVSGRRFEVASGWQFDLVASPDLAPRPITACFDDQGHLYVADSSGSNAPVQEQLANPSHRIVRLTDDDGDGRFDRSTVFAEKVMFPEGTLWHEGSLYVSAPPAIWKFTDRDGDGVSDAREVWFDGKTLTGCANDLHGPYLGRDGWIYWCKGAFDEQTYERGDGSRWSTRASHIFRRRLEGGLIESVMAGGMDNPVDVVFTSAGERLFTTTFLTHPGQGERDGVIHAIYGGVYGKDHGVINGHLRTGDLMPPLVHLGAAAPSGLALLEDESWRSLNFTHALPDGTSAPDQASEVLAVACFNLHQVMHVPLVESGATFDAQAHAWVTAESLDFHPTDVVPDADGSLLVVDTGGWYKLCCPTSQFERPEVLGGIYRLSKIDAQVPADPRGLSIDWEQLTPSALAQLYDDSRPWVRDRAVRETGRLSIGAAAVMLGLAGDTSVRSRVNAVWGSCRLTPDARTVALTLAMSDRDSQVVQAASHAISVTATESLRETIEKRLVDSPQPLSAAALRAGLEALGRIGNAQSVDQILRLSDLLDKQSTNDSNRILEHALIYACIEIGQRAQERDQVLETLKRSLASTGHEARVAAIALDQLGASQWLPEVAIAWLDHKSSAWSETGAWLVERHADWAEQIAPHAIAALDQLQAGKSLPAWAQSQLARPELAPALAQWIDDMQAKDLASDQLAFRIAQLPSASAPALGNRLNSILKSSSGESRAQLLAWLLPTDRGWLHADESSKTLRTWVEDASRSDEERLSAAALLAPDWGSLSDELFAAALERFAGDDWSASDVARLALHQSNLSEQQQLAIVAQLGRLPAARLERVFELVSRHPRPEVGRALIEQLEASETYKYFSAERLRERLIVFGESMLDEASGLFAGEQERRAEQQKRLIELESSLPSGDVARGQQLFHLDRIGCIRCHQMGYVGGRTGPDLTRIGGIRGDRDLLEAIVFPNASFVRSYESWSAETIDGGQFQGIMTDQDAATITLAWSPTESVRLDRQDLVDLSPSEVSIMPSGFDQQLSAQELADLIAFLKASR